MSSSVYSIVLNDEVVSAVDVLAYRAGVSRSAYINNLLAQKVAYVTPEQRIRSILENMEKLLSGSETLIPLPISGEGTLSIKSPFKYKYNPSVRYSVVLNKTTGEGELRVVMRTQNEALLNELDSFLKVFIEVEKSVLDGKVEKTVKSGIMPGKFFRTIYIPLDRINEEMAAKRIASYINAFDRIMKTYFADNDKGNVKRGYEKALNDIIRNGIEPIYL